jgi:hypothetical protein
MPKEAVQSNYIKKGKPQTTTKLIYCIAPVPSITNECATITLISDIITAGNIVETSPDALKIFIPVGSHHIPKQNPVIKNGKKER